MQNSKLYGILVINGQRSTQHNETQHINTFQNNTQHNYSAQCSFECHNVAHYPVCRYADCRFIECHGANGALPLKPSQRFFFFFETVVFKQIRGPLYKTYQHCH